MKRIVFAIALVALASVGVNAEPVGRTEAFTTAQHYMLSKGKILSQRKAPFRSVRKVNGQPESAYYYVFNAEGDNGYVIVSGDDRTPEILGYVENGSFDEETIPENMKSWLQLYVDQIKFLADNNITVNRNAIKARAKAQATRRSIPELLTTRWNQGRPYNLTCPDYYLEDDTKEATALPLKNGPATGCTATAMAQVMNYYKFPPKLKNTIPGYTITYWSKKSPNTSKSVTQKAIAKSTPIDWEHMLDKYNWDDNHQPDKYDSAVANLMHYCGQAVNMHYGPQSGANFSADAYFKYFGYDNSCYVGERGDYSIDDWFNMLYNEISQGYPVLFSGFSSGGGHAFVLDGFDGEQLFHLNWGWGGGSNGWFLVGILNPGDNSGIGASSSSDGYSMSQRALFNLRLPDSNSADTYLFIRDVSVSGTSIRATFENRTTGAGSFNTGIVRLDDEGTPVLVGSSQSISSMTVNSSATKTFPIKGKLTEGTYRLSPASKAIRNTVWRPKYDMRSQYIEAVVDADGNVTLTPVNISRGSSISIDTITFPGTRVAGTEQEVKVTFRNNGNEYFKEIHFFASQSDQKIYTDHRSIVAVRKGETVDVSYFFTPEETGTYNLWFCTSNNGSGEVGTGTMEVISSSEAPSANLAVSAYTVSNLVGGYLYGSHMIGKASIRNNAKTDFKGRIRLQLWRQPNGAGSAWGGSSRTYDMDIMAGKVAAVDFDFDDLSENNRYYIAASFVDATGTFSKSGVWDFSGYDCKSGIELVKTDGVYTGKAWASAMSTASNICGVYADCSKNISRMSPNIRNSNVIYAFSARMDVPDRLDTSNVVSGGHADKIKLVNDQPYFVPVNFTADSALFSYTFPQEAETPVSWYSVTMPFDVDSISRGEFTYQLNDSLNHFWIYEFAQTDDNGMPVFKPAKVLHGNVPYLIACDEFFRGKTITFHGFNKPFYRSDPSMMVISSDTYNQYGCTYQAKLKDVYILNDSGTAFEYVTVTKALPPLSSYFTTKLAQDQMAQQLSLPLVPVSTSKSAGWGDVNLDGRIDVSDAEVLANCLVLKAPEGSGIEYGDVDGDGHLTIADLVSLINKVKE